MLMDFVYLFTINELFNNFVNMITSPIMAFLLLAMFFLGTIYQLFSNRINIVGVLAFLSIILFFLGHLLSGNGSLTTLVLILISGLLILLEFFVIGMILGVIGLGLFVLSILIVGGNIGLYSIFLAVIFILAIVEWVICVKHKKRRLPLLSSLILTDSICKESVYASFLDRAQLVGQEAVTHTVLRPSGTIRLGDERYDAVAEGSYISSDVKVKIIYVEGTRIVVRPIEENE